MPNNYKNVRWNFALAALLYLFAFCYFLKKREDKINTKTTIELNTIGLKDEVDNDKLLDFH